MASRRAWTDDETETFIDSIEAMPYLYDKRHRDFKSTKLKEDSYARVARLFENCTVEDVIYRIKSLKDRSGKEFREYEKRRGTGSSAISCTPPTWPFYIRTQFLRDATEFRRVVKTNLPASDSVATSRTVLPSTSSGKPGIEHAVVVQVPPDDCMSEESFGEDHEHQDEMNSTSSVASIGARFAEAVTSNQEAAYARKRPLEIPIDLSPRRPERPDSVLTIDSSASGSSNTPSSRSSAKRGMFSAEQAMPIIKQASEVLATIQQNRATKTPEPKRDQGFGRIVENYLSEMTPRNALKAQHEILTVLLQYVPE